MLTHAPGVVGQAQVAPDDVLEQSLAGLLRRLSLRHDHVAEDGADRKEALGCGADVIEADVVKQDLRESRAGEKRMSM